MFEQKKTFVKNFAFGKKVADKMRLGKILYGNLGLQRYLC